VMFHPSSGRLKTIRAPVNMMEGEIESMDTFSTPEPERNAAPGDEEHGFYICKPSEGVKSSS